VKAAVLNTVRKEKKRMDTSLEKKIRELTNEYDLKSLPLYKKLNDAVRGKVDPETPEETFTPYLTEAEKETYKVALETGAPIKDFWLTCMKNSSILKTEIQAWDEPVLEHLERIEYLPADDALSYKLTFHFGENEHFKNESLEVNMILSADTDEELPAKIETTEIDWHEGKNTT